MKRFLLALSFAVLVPACAGEAVDPASSPDEDAAADRLPSSDPGAASRDATPAVVASCVSRCQANYDTCLGNAEDATDVCLCHNALVACETPCGVRGVLEKCPVP